MLTQVSFTTEEEPEVEELVFADTEINAKAEKLARLLRRKPLTGPPTQGGVPRV